MTRSLLTSYSASYKLIFYPERESCESATLCWGLCQVWVVRTVLRCTVIAWLLMSLIEMGIDIIVTIYCAGHGICTTFGSCVEFNVLEVCGND